MQEELHLLSFLRGLADFLLPKLPNLQQPQSGIDRVFLPGGGPEPLSSHFLFSLPVHP